MNKTTMDKIQKSKAAKAERFATQTIPIDQDWEIVRADELNWEIRHKGKFRGYYGTIASAFQALQGKMIGAEAKNSITEVLRSQRAISERIEDAISELTHTSPPDRSNGLA